MRKTEITEELLNDGPDTYRKGDQKSFDDDKAQQWIDIGWAKDPETGEQGERKPGAQAIAPHNVKQKK